MALLQTLKDFRYLIEVDGVILGTCQEVKPPESSFADVKHGEFGNTIRTAGVASTGDMTIKLLLGSPTEKAYIEAWHIASKTQNDAVYKRTVTVILQDPTGIPAVIDVYSGVWVIKYSPISQLNSLGTSNIMMEITLSVDDRLII